MEKNVPDQDISWEKIIFTWFEEAIIKQEIKLSSCKYLLQHVFTNTAVDIKITNKLLNHVL